MASNNYQELRDAVLAMVDAETDGVNTRDALCGRCIAKLHGVCKHDGSCWVDKIMTALAKPSRNCDVGSAEDQENRFGKECRAVEERYEALREPCHAWCLPNPFRWGQQPFVGK